MSEYNPEEACKILAAENAALRAEVARLSTWVEVAPNEPTTSTPGIFMRWAAPCDCVQWAAFTFREPPRLRVLHRGEVGDFQVAWKAFYLPITLPGEEKQ